MTITTSTATDRLAEVRALATTLMDEHLDGTWTSAFDRAVKRAGLCNHTDRRITVSRPLAERWEVEDMRQTLLHEIAHALVGPGAGHGVAWKRTARSIGYTGERCHTGEVATERMRWLGTCPNGHTLHRARRNRSAAPVSCGRCNSRFDRRYLIVWQQNPEWIGGQR